MFTEGKITEIFYLADEFSKFFDAEQEKSMLSAPQDGKKHRCKTNRMSDAEIIVILIHFHSGGFRCFKHYCLQYICKHCKHLFPNTVSYNRFVELGKEVLLKLVVFIKQVLHKTFEGLASRGKCSMGWFFGFKLHLIINDKGEIQNFVFTTGSVDDREPLKEGALLKNSKGKLFGDKGYIGKALFENLFVDGVQLITKVKNNIKNSLTSVALS